MSPQLALACTFAATVSLLLDQGSKALVQARLRHRSISWGPLLRFRSVQNARNLYSSSVARFFFAALWFTALACTVGLYAGRGWFHEPVACVALAVAFGAAAGNLLDILRRRSIFDFIDLRWWPVFNLADVGIIFGLAVAFWRGL
ncbi:MAG: signal peptidase II [Candidatus Acidiferrales bacterium]